MSKRNGTNAINAIDTFTSQSAKPSEIHRGKFGPKPRSGKISLAQETSFEGSKTVKDIEKAIVKNKAVSMDEPIRVDARGACHHLFFLNLSKINISTSCAIKKAKPEPIAILSVTNGPNSPIICVPINEHNTPTQKPTRTTFRACLTPYRRFVRSVIKNANG